MGALAIATLKTLATILLGGAGGFAWYSLGLPLPWMLGSMIAVSLVAISGLKLGGQQVYVPMWLRTLVVPVIGVMLGTAFTPEIVAGMWHWWITVLALVGYILITTAIVYPYYRYVVRFDPVTSYFSAIPGGLIDMAIIGEEAGGNGRTISLVHFARILFSVMSIPFFMEWLYGPLTGQSISAVARGWDLSPADIAVLLACAVVGYLVGRYSRMPGGQIGGPLIASAIAHGTGFTTAALPDLLVILAQIIVGASLGARFVGVSFRSASSVLGASLGGTLLMFAVTLITAYGVSGLIDEPLPALILAYAPGGVMEISLIALSMSIAVPFVTAHHMARIILAIAIMPTVWRHVLEGRLKRGSAIRTRRPS